MSASLPWPDSPAFVRPRRGEDDQRDRTQHRPERTLNRDSARRGPGTHRCRLCLLDFFLQWSLRQLFRDIGLPACTELGGEKVSLALALPKDIPEVYLAIGPRREEIAKQGDRYLHSLFAGDRGQT